MRFSLVVHGEKGLLHVSTFIQPIQSDIGGDGCAMECAMIARRHQADNIPWVNLAINSGYPSTFKGLVTLPHEPSMLFIRSLRGVSKRLENPLLIRPALIFIVVGQSNAAGFSEHLFASATENVYFGEIAKQGIRWRPGHDPGVIHGRGSVWPLVGDYFQSKLGAGVGFLNLAVGSTKISGNRSLTFLTIWLLLWK